MWDRYCQQLLPYLNYADNSSGGPQNFDLFMISETVTFLSKRATIAKATTMTLQSVKIVKESFICLVEQNSDSLSSKITSSYSFHLSFFAFFKSFLSQLQNDVSDI